MYASTGTNIAEQYPWRQPQSHVEANQFLMRLRQNRVAFGILSE